MTVLQSHLEILQVYTQQAALSETDFQETEVPLCQI